MIVLAYLRHKEFLISEQIRIQAFIDLLYFYINKTEKINAILIKSLRKLIVIIFIVFTINI